MEGGRVLFDASAYMLFEASGDSETQYSDGELDMDSDASAVAEDDAQSCSYRSLLSDSGDARRRLRDEVDSGVVGDFCGSDFDCFSGDEVDDGGGSSDEDEDGVVDQCCRRGNTAAVAKEKAAKSKGCEGSNVKMMNESEGDRLFWEACLAS